MKWVCGVHDQSTQTTLDSTTGMQSRKLTQGKLDFIFIIKTFTQFMNSCSYFSETSPP